MDERRPRILPIMLRWRPSLSKGILKPCSKTRNRIPQSAIRLGKVWMNQLTLISQRHLTCVLREMSPTKRIPSSLWSTWWRKLWQRLMRYDGCSASLSSTATLYHASTRVHRICRRKERTCWPRSSFQSNKTSLISPSRTTNSLTNDWCHQARGTWKPIHQ